MLKNCLMSLKKENESQNEDIIDEKPIAFIPTEIEKAEAFCLNAMENENKTQPVKLVTEEEMEQELVLKSEIEIEEMSFDQDEDDDDFLEKFDDQDSEDTDDDTSNDSKSQSSKLYKCVICDKSFAFSKSLRSHFEANHMDAKEHKCTQCKEIFFNEDFLKAHIKKVHIRYKCSQCDKSYLRLKSLRIHQSTHKEVKDVICPYENCKKAFYHKYFLNTHLISCHSDIIKFLCEICGYRTRFKGALEIHYRTHTGERPYKCPNCDKYFSSKTRVNDHQAIHRKSKNLKCEICEAEFVIPKNLERHKEFHLRAQRNKMIANKF